MDIKITLSSKQYEIRNERIKREFDTEKSMEMLIKKAEDASSVSELEEIALNEGICDYCDFTALNTDAVRSFIKAVVKTLYLYPELRSILNFIGSRTGFDKTMELLYSNDPEFIRQSGLRGICYKNTLPELAGALEHSLRETYEQEEETGRITAALTLNTGGLLDCVVLDEKCFGDSGYEITIKVYENEEKTNVHPKGCNGVESLFFHEFGHLLENLSGLTSSKKFCNYFKRLGEKKIAEGLSKYATMNIREFFAEAFSEYMSSESPREVSLFVMDLFEESRFFLF